MTRNAKDQQKHAEPKQLNSDKERVKDSSLPDLDLNLDDDEAFAIASYAAIRKFFYGSPDVQNELRDDFIWEAHRQAVRSAFPKSRGEVNELSVRFDAIRTMFWNAVDAACALVGKTRNDLPDHFNAEEMLAWAMENGMTEDDIRTYSQTFSMISLNLLQNNRNWDEMFV